MIDTPRLALPLLAIGQAQKEMTHNEALTRLDLVVQAVVRGIIDAPPINPALGECWIVGAAPTGDWVGQGGAIAGWTEGGWRFVTPREGWRVALVDGGGASFVGGAWRVWTPVNAPLPAGGTTVDAEARAALAALIPMLRAAGFAV